MFFQVILEKLIVQSLGTFILICGADKETKN
jgi:hypothetical protein